MLIIVPVMGLVIMLVSMLVRIRRRMLVLSNSGRLQRCGDSNITPVKLGNSLCMSQILIFV